MKLAFYSGGFDYENPTLDKHLIQVLDRKDPQVTFVPSSSYLSHMEFKRFVGQYKRFGVKKFLHFPIDVPFTEVLKSEVFNSDLIHLGGGNTFYFLKHLRRCRLMKKLREFVHEGGMLSGLSAGAILMTRSVETASFPDFDRDENEEGVTNFKGLGLVNFEFFPHYKNSMRYDQALLKHSLRTHNPIYASVDGSGLVVAHGQRRFVGKNFCFFQGKKFQIS